MKLTPSIPRNASLALLGAFTLATLPAISQQPTQRDYVPNAETAVSIAEAVLIPVYGKKLVESERPYMATLQGDVWKVGATLYCPDGKPQSDVAPTCVGGTAVVELSKHDAHIISMIHHK